MNLEQTRRAWETQAEAYDSALTATDMQAAERALHLARVGPGTRVLDIAAGGGALSIPAARLGADVLAVDYSHAMVRLLDRKAMQMGLSSLETRVMDGTALQLDSETFDVACSELGIMLFPDRARGLREMARVVKAGGRGVMVVLGPAPRVEIIALFFEAMMKVVRGFTPPRQSPLFCLQHLADLKREMEEAGFSEVTVEPFDAWIAVESGEQLWQTITAGAPAVAGMLRPLQEAQRAEVRRELIAKVRSRAGDAGPTRFTMAFNIGVGVKAAN